MPMEADATKQECDIISSVLSSTPIKFGTRRRKRYSYEIDPQFGFADIVTTSSEL